MVPEALCVNGITRYKAVRSGQLSHIGALYNY